MLFATIIARAFSFLASWLALQLIENKELGVVLFAFSIIQFLIPFGGFGLYQGLLRYGALLKKKEDKNTLFVYVLKKGFLISILIVFTIIVIGYFVTFKFENTYFYLSILSFSIVTNYVFQLIKIQFRLQHNNKIFAYADIIYSTILVVSVLILSYYFKEIGYTIALITSPLLVTFIFISKLKIDYKSKKKLSIINREFWRYSFFGSLASVAPQLLVTTDLLLVGSLLSDPEMVTIYKYVSLIPASLLFLPQVFMATDYVAITEKINNKTYIFNYIKSYMLLFTLISFLFFGFFYFFSKETLTIFNTSFAMYSESFLILVFGVSGILIFRGLFGNLLSSIGKVDVNYYIISIALMLNLISNYYLIPLYGIKGAAITSAFLMWFTGLFSCGWFFYLYKKMYTNE